MAKLMPILLSVAAIGLAGAPVAQADEQGFVDAIASHGHYAVGPPEWINDDLVKLGYRVCEAFDRGGDTAAVQTVLTAYNGDTSESADYYATLFAQSAAYELCPEHNGEIGSI
jgi:hypothetical protein